MRKQSFWILLVLICLLPVLALAADDARTLKPMPKDWVKYEIPDGLAVDSVSLTDGQFSMKINTEDTDWADVILDTGSSSEMFMDFRIYVPEEADYFNLMSNTAVEDEWVDQIDFWGGEPWGDYGRRVENNGDYYASAGCQFATWIGELDSMVVDDTMELKYILVRYYKQTGTKDNGDPICEPLYTYKLRVYRNATTYGMIPFGKSHTVSSDDRIIVDVENALKDVKVEVEDGTITLTPKSKDAYVDHEWEEILVLVEFPEGAVAWSDSKTGDHYTYREQDGKKYAEWWVYVSLFNTNGKGSRSFWFFDENGDVVEKFPLILKKNPVANMQPMEAYMQEVTGGDMDDEMISWKMNWQPVPQQNMKINSVIPSSVYKINYSNGMITTSLNGQGNDLINFSDNGESIDIIAPKNAKSFRANNSGAASWGPGEKWDYIDMSWNVMDSDPQPIVNGKARVWDSGSVLRQVEITGSDLTVYIPVQYNHGNEYYKQTNLIYFYDVPNPTPETKPIAQWYYTRMDDDNYFLTVSNKSYASEADIPDGLTDPCIVDPYQRGYQLRVRYYLQGGKNARHFELSVVDTNGNPIKLKKGEGVYVYLPYTASSDKKHWVHHFGNDLYTSSNPKYDLVEVTNTSKGLRFYAESFSPFVLNWEAETVSISIYSNYVTGLASGEYNVGDIVTMIATNPAGKEFAEWVGLEDVQFVSGSIYTPTVSFIVPDHDLTIFALYGEAGAASQPPKTGDSTPLMAWFALAALSAAGMVIVLQKRRHS